MIAHTLDQHWATSATQYAESRRPTQTGRLAKVALQPLEIMRLFKDGSMALRPEVAMFRDRAWSRVGQKRTVFRTSWSKMTREELGKYLSYDPDTGDIRWKVDIGRCRTGDEAGTIHRTGYRIVRIARQDVPATRIAWLMHHGTHAPGVVYLANGDKLDLRACNLTLERVTNARVAA